MIQYSRIGIRGIAKDLAEFLKSTNRNRPQLNNLAYCIEKLVDNDENTASVSMQSIPTTVFNTFKSLLFSEKFADVIFEITDDSESSPTVTRLFAHKSILASSSIYFETMLSGDWNETSNGNQSHAIIKVNHNLDVYRCLLTFIYTGEIDTDIVDKHSLELLDLAAQGEYDALTSMCQIKAIKIIAVNNVVHMLLSSYRHSLDLLRHACFEFIKANSVSLMFNESFMELAQSHKQIWKHAKKALGQVVDDDNDESKQEGEDNI